MNEIATFSSLYENYQIVLENPTIYAEKITNFCAGGLGAAPIRMTSPLASLPSVGSMRNIISIACIVGKLRILPNGLDM